MMGFWGGRISKSPDQIMRALMVSRAFQTLETMGETECVDWHIHCAGYI